MPSSAMRHPRFTAAQFRLLVGFILAGLTAAGAAATDGCRAFPGSRDWPSGHVWASLNDKLGGRLLSPPPPAAACHTGQPSYVAAVCPGVQRSWAQSAWHAADPVSVMWDQFTNYSCLPDPRTPCSGQGYPPYVVDASTAEHVKIGIDFAREHNIRVVVKSSGHDYMGRSIAPGALSIWTRHLNGVKFHPGSFRLGGSARVIKGSSMTVGGGVSTYEAYKAADKHHQTIVGGNDGSVSFGGYITGGGHSYTAPHYGLAADNVLELEVVTPTGRILTVNEDRHPDLFWALRGGGGSTFGVITKITMSTHPGVKVVHVDWMIVADGKAKFLWDMISYVISTLPYLLDPGLSGASSINSSFPNPSAAPGLPSRVGGVVGRNIMLGVDDAKEVKRIFRPINETLNQRWPGAVSLIVKTKEHPSFLDWYEGHLNSSDAGYGQYLASRLLDRAALTGDSAALRGALKAGDKPHGQRGFLAVAGKGVQEATPRGGNAVNPAWRKAYVHAVAAARFPPLNKEAERLAVKVLDRSLQPLRNLTPGSGAYINEALPFEKDWQSTFWGSNYERLHAIKRAVDPHDTLVSALCRQRPVAGASRWSSLPCRVDGCRQGGSKAGS